MNKTIKAKVVVAASAVAAISGLAFTAPSASAVNIRQPVVLRAAVALPLNHAAIRDDWRYHKDGSYYDDYTNRWVHRDYYRNRDDRYYHRNRNDGDYRYNHDVRPYYRQYGWTYERTYHDYGDY